MKLPDKDQSFFNFYEEVETILFNFRYCNPQTTKKDRILFLLCLEFLKFNAEKFINVPNCNFHYSNFGISVIPKWFSHKLHDGLYLLCYRKKIGENDFKFSFRKTYLPSQIYLHDLYLINKQAYLEGFETKFSIYPIYKEKMAVEFTPKN